MRSLILSPSAPNGLLAAPDVRARADSASAHSQHSGAYLSIGAPNSGSGTGSANARALGAYWLCTGCAVVLLCYAQLDDYDDNPGQVAGVGLEYSAVAAFVHLLGPCAIQ